MKEALSFDINNECKNVVLKTGLLVHLGTIVKLTNKEYIKMLNIRESTQIFTWFTNTVFATSIG